MQEVRWGILGCGAVCEHKGGPPLYRLPRSRLLAVMRRDGAAAADYARRHGVERVYDQQAALLADPELDAIYVATPDHAHAAGSIAAAVAGKHVLVEKAMAHDAAGCRAMIEACRAHNVVLAVAYYRRCYPSILAARMLLAEGAIGRLRQLRLNDEFPLSHRLDLIHFFTGRQRRLRQIDAVCCVDDHCGPGPTLVLENHDDVLSQTRHDWQEHVSPERLYFHGENGEIIIDDLKAGRLVLRRSGRPEEVRDCGPLPYTHWGLMENFIGHLCDGRPLACDGDEGRRSTVILDALELLDDTCRNVDYDEGR